MVANGDLDAEFVHGEGEHAQLSVVYGASAAGGRAYTGSSGVGVTYAMEVYSPISGERLPLQMAIADRTLDPPGDFGSEHMDALSIRDQGFLQGWASTPQEVLDNTLAFYRLGEDPRILLPQAARQDGYYVSHILNAVDIPDQAQVDEFLPPYKNHHILDPRDPMIIGPQIEPEMGPPLQFQRWQLWNTIEPVVEEVWAQFAEVFGRKYDPFIEKTFCDDAEVIVIGQGGHIETAKTVAAKLRGLGEKVGVARLRLFRPFPTKAVREALANAKAIVVFDNSFSFGMTGRTGPMAAEIKAALYGVSNAPVIQCVGGLGGEVMTREEFYCLFKKGQAFIGKHPAADEAFISPFHMSELD
jgi:pyruvate ferredoxin oxidoreductase alpha subunit/oxalate oxidoreductase subunit alpha